MHKSNLGFNNNGNSVEGQKKENNLAANITAVIDAQTSPTNSNG